MTRLQIRTVETAPPASRGLLQGLKGQVGFVSNPRRQTTSRFHRLTTIVVLALVAAGPVAAQEGAKTAAPPTLYARLGGYDFIAKFVDTAFPRVAAHPQLPRLFQGHSRDSQVRQRQLIIDALCQATGGPCAYVGRPMKPVHAGLDISESDWTVFSGILGATLEEMKVAASERQDVLSLLERRFKPDVVQAPADRKG